MSEKGATEVAPFPLVKCLCLGCRPDDALFLYGAQGADDALAPHVALVGSDRSLHDALCAHDVPSQDDATDEDVFHSVDFDLVAFFMILVLI